MRLRHIPGCEEFIRDSKDCISGNDLLSYKGGWKELFGNDNEINIEIGMGKGRFIRDLAAYNPDINYIGIERYESVLMKALQRKHKREEQEEEYKNLYFMCADAKMLAEYFEKGEVSRIYLNFSDPWPKARHSERRLTSKTFLDVYSRILNKDGRIEFKTDNIDLFNYSLESIPEANWKILFKTFDLHKDIELGIGEDEYIKGNIMTEYEEKFSSKGQKICKLVAIQA